MPRKLQYVVLLLIFAIASKSSFYDIQHDPLGESAMKEYTDAPRVDLGREDSPLERNGYAPIILERPLPDYPGTSVPMRQVFSGEGYVIDMLIGWRGNYQSIPVMLDTGKATTWVLSALANDAGTEMFPKLRSFHVRSRRTMEIWLQDGKFMEDSTGRQSGTMSGLVSKSDFIIPGHGSSEVIFEKMIFVAVSSASGAFGETGFQESAVLGLGSDVELPRKRPQVYRSIFQFYKWQWRRYRRKRRLWRKWKMVPIMNRKYRRPKTKPRPLRALYSFYVNAQNSSRGCFQWNTYDSRFFSGPISWIPAQHHLTSWELVPLISGIDIGGKRSPFCDNVPCRAAVHTSVNNLMVDPDMAIDMIKYLAVNPSCINMTNPPDITFNFFGGFKIRLEPKDYIKVNDYDGDTQTCTVQIAPHMTKDTYYGQNYFIFGKLLMRKLFTIFDGDQRRIGFAKSKDSFFLLNGCKNKGSERYVSGWRKISQSESKQSSEPDTKDDVSSKKNELANLSQSRSLIRKRNRHRIIQSVDVPEFIGDKYHNATELKDHSSAQNFPENQVLGNDILKSTLDMLASYQDGNVLVRDAKSDTFPIKQSQNATSVQVLRHTWEQFSKDGSLSADAVKSILMSWVNIARQLCTGERSYFILKYVESHIDSLYKTIFQRLKNDQSDSKVNWKGFLKNYKEIEKIALQLYMKGATAAEFDMANRDTIFGSMDSKELEDLVSFTDKDLYSTLDFSTMVLRAFWDAYKKKDGTVSEMDIESLYRFWLSQAIEVSDYNNYFVIAECIDTSIPTGAMKAKERLDISGIFQNVHDREHSKEKFTFILKVVRQEAQLIMEHCKKRE